ncbi:hypothetical protein J8281_03405 [Aquimarina sp. U1-2]|uniref:hypothetical protein n=1 Tax=Aquimarina sp. U1-2 TaxID=2823141 RepID=UPI001AECC9E9|nr:hypothetical protein [Aquimarina sp. U1-2]MBP2831224.1 hypothetical protein [Aquimarina sp. U1-2]
MNRNIEPCENTSKLYLIFASLGMENNVKDQIFELWEKMLKKMSAVKTGLSSFFQNDFNKMLLATVGYMFISVVLMLTAFALIVY